MSGSRAFALGGLAVAIFGAGGAIIVRVATQAPFLPVTFGFGQAAMISFIVLGLSWASIGAFLVIRRPENAVGSVMVVAGAGYALSMFFTALTFGFAAHGTAQGQRLAELAGWTSVLCTQFGAALFVVGFIFPTGRGQSPRWGWYVRLSWPFLILLGAALLLQPGSLHLFPTLQNPFGVGPDLRGGAPMSPLIGLFSALLAPSMIVSLVSRYRVADQVERQQLKWFGLALVVALVGVGFSALMAVVANQTPSEVGLTVYGFAGAGVPVAIAIAILRHHLYDIDRIVSRTIAYAIVSAILGLVVGGVILLLSTALASYTQGQTIAVAASTLIAFAAFQPVLRRVRAEVDRRFDRARYDAERTVAEFADRLRDQIDLADLSSDLDATIHEAIAPRSFGIWLRDSQG
jgi:hypothetical protein